MRFIFKGLAKTEFFEAIVWYENQRPGLGREFAHDVIQTLKLARRQPELFPKARRGARKIRLRRFQAFSVYFAIKEDCFAVIAVFHGARNPKDLRHRLGQQ